MKKLLIFTLLLGAVSTATGQVTLKVCEADGETPFDCNHEVMVGSKLAIIVCSDTNDYWSGGLFISGQERAFGTLAARNFDPNTRDWAGSHYEEAGDLAKVTAWKDSSIWGFDLYTFYPVTGNSENTGTVAGDWFIIDYYADEVGDCNVGFYDYSISWDDPNDCIIFSHVPTRDLNSDEVVNFEDFAMFVSKWNAADCNGPNWCQGADLDRDGGVDHNDLRLFGKYWLWPPSSSEPNEPDMTCPEDANVTYRIVDFNDNNEITLDVNDTIALYVRMATTGQNNVRTFNIEINISDTNLGSIDNREYDSSDPNSSTARILAEPRLPWADYCGPGWAQEEGIRFYATNLDAPISDGNLASFVFTCEGQGDVRLELVNWYSYNTDSEDVCPRLQSILIHQVDPNSEQMMGAGMDSMLVMQEESQQSQAEQQIDIDEMVSWLEELWFEDETIRERYTRKEWNEFIDSVKDWQL